MTENNRNEVVHQASWRNAIRSLLWKTARGTLGLVKYVLRMPSSNGSPSTDLEDDEDLVEAIEQTNSQVINLPALDGLRRDGVRGAGSNKLCIDFGTSGCALAWSLPQGPRLATLDFRLDNQDNRIGLHAIPSTLAWKERKKDTDEYSFGIRSPDDSEALIGNAAFDASDGSRLSGYWYCRSLKRMISDLRREELDKKSVDKMVTDMIEELLYMAVLSRESASFKRSAEEGQQPLDQYILGMGIPGFQTSHITQDAPMVLFMSVPNAFGEFECDLIRKAGKEALKRFHLRLWSGNNDAALPLTEVRILREADAVAWWELHNEHLKAPTVPINARWMIFDIGGGSTDVAVTNALFKPDPLGVTQLCHSGVTFGGNDVDELLFRSVAMRYLSSKGRPGTDEELDTLLMAELPASAKTKTRGERRQDALKIFQQQKILWSQFFHERLEENEARKSQWSAWLNWLANNTVGERPAFDEEVDWALGLRTDRDVSHEDKPVFWDPPVSEVPQIGKNNNTYVPLTAFIDAYGRFLRAVVCGVVDDIREHRIIRESPALDRVILSGRGAQLPGVKELLELYLVDIHKLVSDRSKIRYVVPNEQPDDLKLACVRGVAIAARYPMSSEIGDTVSEDIIYQIVDQVTIWKRGSRLMPDAPSQATLHLARLPGGGAAALEFYQNRVPNAVARTFPDSHQWKQRYITGFHVNLNKKKELMVQFDHGRWKLSCWQLTHNQPPTLIKGSAAPPTASFLNNPVTGLTFGWGDEDR